MPVIRSKLAVCSLLLLPLFGCGSDGDRPYRVSFTNDTADAVTVVGCPDCGEGYPLAAGAAWETSLGGGSTKIRFDRDGTKVGCMEFINGDIPDDDAPPSVVKVSEGIPCRQ